MAVDRSSGGSGGGRVAIVNLPLSLVVHICDGLIRAD